MIIGIVSAGITGLSTALFLHQAGFAVTVYERNESLSTAGAGIQIPPNASIHLSKLGLLPRIRELAFEPKAIEFRRYATSELLSQVSGAPMVEKVFGYPYLLIHRADYQKILYDACVAAGIDVIFGTAVKGIDENEPALMLGESKRIPVDLVVAADGVYSTIRKSLVKSPSLDLILGTHRAYRALIPSELMRTIPYGQQLIDSGTVNNWVGPERHVVGYPISKSYYNIVLIHPGPVDETESWIQRGSIEEMHVTFADFDPQLRSVLGLITDVRAWKLSEMPEMPHWSTENGKVILIGDAAHAMLPHAAQGAAQGVEDAVALAACLKSVESSADVKSALATFEDLRKPRVRKIAAAARRNQDVWQLPDGMKQEERDWKWKTAATVRNDDTKLREDGASNTTTTNPSEEKVLFDWLWRTNVQVEVEAALKRLGVEG